AAHGQGLSLTASASRNGPRGEPATARGAVATRAARRPRARAGAARHGNWTPRRRKEVIMTKGTRFALGGGLADFTALTGYAVYQYGIDNVLPLCFANAVTTTLFVDASIALALITAWMWQDARREGRAWLPYVLVTLTLGSVGPLLYLVTGAVR